MIKDTFLIAFEKSVEFGNPYVIFMQKVGDKWRYGWKGCMNGDFYGDFILADKEDDEVAIQTVRDQANKCV